MKYYDISEVTNVKVHGRTKSGASPLPLFWNHSGVEVNCDGSELWIDIDVDCDFHEPWIAIEINGALMQRRMLLPDDKRICLFRSMTKGTVKNVRFYRELQAMSEDDRCHVLVKGFETDGEFFPVPEKELKLEFIGDSISSGEGTYGATSDTEWLAMYMSSSRHYAAIIEKAMDADVRIISQGGWGVCSGWDNDVRHSIPKIYEPICGLAWGENNEKLGALDKNDYEGWAPDAIVVNLGTNDNSAFNTPPIDVPGVGMCKKRRNADGSLMDEDLEIFRSACVDFLKNLRRLNKNSYIVWAYGMLGNELEPAIRESIERFKKETGDRKAFFLPLSDTNEKTFGAHMHPGYAAHKIAAREIGTFLADLLNVKYEEPLGNL